MKIWEKIKNWFKGRWAACRTPRNPKAALAEKERKRLEDVAAKRKK